MRIVGKQEFLKLPAGTLFSKFRPYVFGPLTMKCSGDDEHGDDWKYAQHWEQELGGCVLMEHDTEDWLENIDRGIAGESVPTDFTESGTKTYAEPDQMFAVWEPEDFEKFLWSLTSMLQTVADAALRVAMELPVTAFSDAKGTVAAYFTAESFERARRRKT